MAVPRKATASGFNQTPSPGLTPCTWTGLSVLCWEFLEQSLVFNQSLFSSCRTLSTHISKALTKFLGLHIFLTPNENQPGWSCEYCPCSCDSPVSGFGAAAPGAPGSPWGCSLHTETRNQTVLRDAGQQGRDPWGAKHALPGTSSSPNNPWHLQTLGLGAQRAEPGTGSRGEEIQDTKMTPSRESFLLNTSKQNMP